MTSRLLIVSNRLPFTVETTDGSGTLRPSAGGVASALRTPHEEGAIWFGWPGDLSTLSEAERQRILQECEKNRTVPIELSEDEVAEYYDSFSNGVIWPLFHYLLEKVRLDADSGWEAFRRVNERFARAVAERYQPGDTIWVHDYQLALVPGMLRLMLPGARIGYFLHIPWPATDVFRILPWREELLRGILGADLVGFHTASYRHNFSFSAARVLGIELGIDEVSFEDRQVQLGVYPIGIDANRFERLAHAPEVEALVRNVKAEAHGKKIILGVDRLDYTKGIPQRFLAFDRFLEQNPAYRDRVHFIQLAVPTRERIDAYAELRSETNELAGRINSQRGSPLGSPLHFLYRSLPEAELVALYRAADVMLVTPLRDGMNLVAKEYVMSHVDERGVLVLSEFAGAADELLEAVIVNAYDVRAMARGIQHALEMPESEQKVRMAAMRSHVREQDAHWWTERFIEDLSTRRSAPGIGGESDATALRNRVVHGRRASRKLLLLDYDGTLVPLMPLPELAAPDPRLLALLSRLGSLENARVHLISGRPRQSLETWLGELPITLHAEHGYWTRTNGTWIPHSPGDLAWQKPVLEIMTKKVASTPGSFVEQKSVGLAFHYRGCDPSLVNEKLAQLRQELSEVQQRHAFDQVPGAKVLEARMCGVSKGSVVQRLAAGVTSDDFLLIAGDDLTDEEMFAAAPPSAVSIHVGRGRSKASFRVDDCWAMREVLDQLVIEDFRDDSAAVAKDPDVPWRAPEATTSPPD
jgi:trehalose 6-phosphate synthase/phosphatase